MTKLKKISPETNVVTWFEIPVHDSQRARAFYEVILDIQMNTQHIPETNEELTFFPSDPNVVQATSGRVTGVLTKSAKAKPSADGTLIYINASPAIQTVLDNVERAGGKILVQAMRIKAGLIAIILDTEGNRIGLHAEA